MTLMSKPGKGSLVSNTAAQRAVINATATLNGEPVVGDGVACSGFRWAQITLQSATDVSADFALWTFDYNSGKYVRDDQLGDTGTIQVLTATEGGLQRHWFDLTGVDEFYVELEAVSAAAEDASAWITLSM